MDNTEKYFSLAEEVARKSTCLRAKCGSVIISIEGEVIASGFNSPPRDLESQRRCMTDKSSYDSKVTDKTCCIHAEQRALLAADRNRLVGSTLYFIRLDQSGTRSFSGNPYCTICSKMALDLGVKYFGLFHKDGPVLYETEEYNQLSFDYSSV